MSHSHPKPSTWPHLDAHRLALAIELTRDMLALVAVLAFSIGMPVLLCAARL